MTVSYLYQLLGDIKGKRLVDVVVAPDGGSQHVERIIGVEFVPELNSVVIRCAEKD